MRLRLALPVVSLLLVFGCGDDSAMPPMPDASPPDAQDIDAAPVNDIGAACMRPNDPTCRGAGTNAQGTCNAAGELCQISTCRGGLPWPDGYCTQSCSSTNPCPSGSICVDIGNQTAINRCLKTCTTHQDCRMPGVQYVCQPTRSGNVCMGGQICEAAPANLSTLRGDWGTNTQVPEPTAPILSQFASEGMVASDRNGHLAISEIDLYTTSAGTNGEGSVMGVAIYDETGQSFHTPVAYGEYPSTMYTSDPVVAYDTEVAGTPKPLYLVWINIDASQTLHTLVAKSIDGGSTFGPPNNIASAAVNTSGQDVSGTDAVFDKPWIAASNGKVYVTYSGANGQHEMMVVSEDAGVTWTAPQAIDTTGGFHNFGQVTVATQTGDVFVTYLGGAGIVGSRWLRSANATWFEPEVDIGGSGNVANPSGVAVSRDATHLWAVWDDAPGATGSNIKASVATAANTGAALAFPATPVTVNDDTSCGDHIHATVAVDDMAIGHILWLDNRYSGGVIQGVAHYAKSTTAAGTAFTTPVVVSDALFPFTTSRVPGLWLGDYIGIVTTSTKVWAAWADPRSGTPNRTHFFIASRPLP